MKKTRHKTCHDTITLMCVTSIRNLRNDWPIVMPDTLAHILSPCPFRTAGYSAFHSVPHRLPSVAFQRKHNIPTWLMRNLGSVPSWQQGNPGVMLARFLSLRSKGTSVQLVSEGSVSCNKDRNKYGSYLMLILTRYIGTYNVIFAMFLYKRTDEVRNVCIFSKWHSLLSKFMFWSLVQF
jgi:hypothetical protein